MVVRKNLLLGIPSLHHNGITLKASVGQNIYTNVRLMSLAIVLLFLKRRVNFK